MPQAGAAGEAYRQWLDEHGVNPLEDLLLRRSERGRRVLARKDPRVSGLVAAALALHGVAMPEQYTRGWVIAL